MTPTCATLPPAVVGTELRTVLLAGEFGFGEDNRPVRIDVVGPLRTVSGRSLRGLRIRDVDETNVGPRMVFGEFFALRDIDGDNHVDACLGAQALNLDFQRVAVDGNVFFSPQNTTTPAGMVVIQP
ncbi:MAG: hypothetical protein AAFZ18_23020 [Myxococcota bacterium]